MSRRLVLTLTLLIAVCVAGVLGVLWYEDSRYARIDEWSIGIKPDGFDWAEVSTGYGIEKKSYILTEEDLIILTNLLQQVTEENCSRKTPKGAERIDYRLSLEYEGKLWLFHCLSNGMLRIVFEDPETAEYFGCDDSRLYVELPGLYDFIVELVNARAE